MVGWSCAGCSHGYPNHVQGLNVMPWAAKTKQSKKRKHDKTMPCRRYQKLYSRKAWKELRHSHLMSNPLCVQCLANGISKAAVVCDHIEPHKGNVTMFFDRDNLQSLCKRCHDKKTYAESIGK